jgi:Uncharacterized protein containing a Zn-ribbon (DUF2116)
MSPARMPRLASHPQRVLQTPEDTPGAHCAACGKPVVGRRQTCSGRCRVARHRQRQAETRAARDAEVRHHAEAIIRLLEGGRTR